jgi:hypothetical protein
VQIGDQKNVFFVEEIGTMKKKRNPLAITMFTILAGAVLLALYLLPYLNIAPAIISSVSWNL